MKIKRIATMLLITAMAMGFMTGCDEVTETETLSLQQVNEDGFGKTSNQYAWAMETFKGSVYVATLNAENALPAGMLLFFWGQPFKSAGVDIQRGTIADNGEWVWENVLTEGNGNTSNFGIRKMKAIGDFLYAVTVNHVDGFQVWRTVDGESWEAVSEYGFGDINNTSGRGLMAYKGYIYAGVENREEGAQIWRRKITDNGDFAAASAWEQVISGGIDDASNYWFSDFVEYNGYFYTGTLNPTGMELWRTNDGVNYEMLFDDGNGYKTNTAAMKLYAYDNKLYVGTMNFLTGSYLYANSDEDGAQFDAVMEKGNGHFGNAYVWYMKEYNDRLYVGTFKDNGGFHLYSAKNPGVDEWTVETKNGFGHPGHYGIRSMAVYQDKLLIGTATPLLEQSCKVWEATAKPAEADAE
ncbi:MAG: hypothetical protein GY754_32630 [bacterium]|nr:hypothetical protein [bacterium]